MYSDYFFVVVVKGQTLDKCGLYLPEEIFTHGQMYVALSRVRSSDSITVFKPEDKKYWNHRKKLYYVKNIVFSHVLT